jgi:PiT family inorganic phosphate transporter
MPNLAATDTGGAADHRMRTISLVLVFLITACGIAHVGVHSDAGFRFVNEGPAPSFALRATSYRVLH